MLGVNILIDTAPKRHVQDLMASADTHDRYLAVRGQTQQDQVELIPERIHVLQGWYRLLPHIERMDITSPTHHQAIQPGDQLVDTVKNYKMGTVVSVRSEPALVQVLDQETRSYVDAVLEGFEDVYVTVESTCTDSEEALLLDGGYDFRVGQTTYVRGPGYMGSGPVTEIVREAEG